MKSKLTSVFTFLSILIIVFLALNITFKKKKPRVVACKPAQIDALFVENSSSKTKVIREKGEMGRMWMIELGEYREDADQDHLQTLLLAYCYMPYEELFDKPTEPEEAALYGFDQSPNRVTLFADTKIVLTLGNSTPSGSEYYLASSESPEKIYTIKNKLADIFKINWLDLRMRQLIPLEKSRRVSLSFFEKNLLLEHADKEWKPVSAPLAREMVGKLINLIDSFAYEKYYGPLEADQTDEYGFFLPDIQIQVEDDSQSSKSYAISHYNNRYYLLSEIGGQKFVFVLFSQTVTDFFNLLQEIKID